MGRAVAAGIAFLVGFALVLAGIVGFDAFFPGAWLPCSLSIILFALLGMGPDLQAIRWPYAISVGSGVILFWLRAADVKFTGFVAHSSKLLAGIATFSFVFWLAAAFIGKKRSPVVALSVLAICFWLVAYFSSGHGGGNYMVIWVRHTFHLDAAEADLATFWMRKSIHVLFYGTVGLTALMIGRKSGAATPALFGLLIALSLASFDEYRQSYFDNRSSSIYDVMLDMSGAGGFILLGILRQGSMKKIRA